MIVVQTVVIIAATILLIVAMAGLFWLTLRAAREWKLNILGYVLVWAVYTSIAVIVIGSVLLVALRP